MCSIQLGYKVTKLQSHVTAVPMLQHQKIRKSGYVAQIKKQKNVRNKNKEAKWT